MALHSDTHPRVGIIGAGGIARPHARGWAALNASIHVFSLEGASDLADATPGAATCDSLDDLLSQVDMVDICTPTDAHADLVRWALHSGKHVMCEKPVTLDMAEMRELAHDAQFRGLVLYPAHVVRFFPQYVALHHAVERGRLGRLAVLRFERSGSRPLQPWFSDVSRSGGLTADQMIHDVDQALWLAGPLKAAYGVQHESGDAVAAHVTLTHRSGAISHCQGLWGPQGTRFHYSFDVAGSAGRLAYDSARNTGLVFDVVERSAAPASYLPDVPADRNPYSAEVQDFWRTTQGAQTPRVTPADAVAVIEANDAIARSLATGLEVKL